MTVNASLAADRDVTRVKPAPDTSCSSATDASARARGDASSIDGRPVCAWCRGPIRAAARRDALCCSVRCRQARHRFTTAVGSGVAAAGGMTLRLAYADPPYPGKSRLYVGHPDYAGEVDHPALIRRLSTYDGWALSTSAEALPQVLASCPPGARVAAWVRGERPTRSARPQNAWEPVIYFGGRAVERALETRRVDTLVLHARPRLTDPRRVIGAKPAGFCRWMFDLLGAQPGDELDDLFPGSGGVTRAWASFTAGIRVAEDRHDESEPLSEPHSPEPDRAGVIGPGPARVDGIPATRHLEASPTRRPQLRDAIAIGGAR